MKLNHLDGLEKIYSLRKNYEKELELVCLNSEYKDKKTIKKLLNQAQSLYNQYPDQVVIKESETHEEKYPYYEISVFCNQDQVSSLEKEIENLGLALDIIHETKDHWSP